MTDRLRELAERWNQRGRVCKEAGSPVSGTQLVECASELLSILDAEGDGGAVAWQYRFLDGEEGPSPYWHDMTREQFEMFLAAANPRYELRQLYTNPARSGGVSDADALAHFTEYFVRNYPGPDTIISNPNWHAPRIFRAAQRAIDAARKGERHV